MLVSLSVNPNPEKVSPTTPTSDYVGALKSRHQSLFRPNPSAKPMWVLPPTTPARSGQARQLHPLNCTSTTALPYPVIANGGAPTQNVILQVSPSHFPSKQPYTNSRLGIPRHLPFWLGPFLFLCTTTQESRPGLGTELGGLKRAGSTGRRRHACVCVWEMVWDSGMNV